MTEPSRIFADLHVHSNASDGVLTPADLVRQARAAGLAALGLTDHDTLRGVPEALTAASEVGLDLIPGIELSCGWPDRDYSFHVLGLFVDHRSPCLAELLERQREARYVRALKMVDLLEGLGLAVQPLRERFLADKDGVLGRPHVARFLVEIGAIPEFQQAFERYLGRGKPAYVPKLQVLPEEGIETIHDAGGLAVIAHPGLIPDWEGVWSRIRTLPWDAVEVQYSEHSPAQVERFTRLIKSHGWLPTGGSDYHGEYGKHTHRLGLFGIGEEPFRRLCEAARLRRGEKA